jgi:AcrR family transcriptional regulator
VKKRQRLSAADRRAQLLEVGRTAFASQGGYEATAIDDIAQQAGVTKPIVYEHFGSRRGSTPRSSTARWMIW